MSRYEDLPFWSFKYFRMVTWCLREIARASSAIPLVIKASS
eukprot:CAMPEP_0205826126 /NCGR_PEP_ID=MMETSP0206-20130828/27719_1 /ASSEMBLY_ACC=CAM_ASM_000279 /TAXON_ID=36767 /ORGANISM="Euplotes focardii, Strain TN1" /LENGTH=40 /DNA_ID= /DNA_START= /DNA_END= /DNA_ORIENTATION=